MIFTFIPLALMAGGAYFRAGALLREQAVEQTENLLVNQVRVVAQEVQIKENKLKEQFEGEGAPLLFETALHANPQSAEFRDIRSRFTKSLLQDESPEFLGSFDAFLLVDKDGKIRLASNEEWQGGFINPALFDDDVESQTLLVSGFDPFYPDEFILVTSATYKTERGSSLGALIGITGTENLKTILQPLNSLAPYARTYFILPGGQFYSINATSGGFEEVSVETSSSESIRLALEEIKGETLPSPVPLDVTIENKDMLAQLVWIPSIQSGAALTIESDTIYSQINNLAPFTFLLVIGTVLAMGVVLFFGTRRVIQPLQSLSNMARKFAEGDRGQRVAVSVGAVPGNEIDELSASFNYLADQIEDSYVSLERKVEERALQIRTAAQVAQSITTIPNLNDMLNKTVELLAHQFNFYQASIFLLDRSGKNIDFKAGYGPATKGLVERKYSLPVDSTSIIGWVAANDQARVASDVAEDELHLKNELLPETRSEACVPISLGNTVLGVINVQSAQPSAFSADAIVMLQTLASQVAAAIQTAGLIESSQVNFQELDRLYRSSRLIAEAKTRADILRVGGQIIKSAPYPVMLFHFDGNFLKVGAVSDAISADSIPAAIQQGMLSNSEDISEYLSRGTTAASSESHNLPRPFREALRQLELLNVVLLPIRGENSLEAVILIGSAQFSPSAASIQPYENLAELMSIAMQRASAVAQIERHLLEVEALASINELIASIADIQGFYLALLSKIQQIIGDFNLIVAHYDEETNTIHIPFSYENGRAQVIPPFPLGEGLTSILIRTRQPLLIVKDTERKAAELGAKVQGKPAKSWMGAPMIVQGSPIGALIIQDLEHENAFDENDLKFFTNIANQVAGVIKNVQLLEESNRKAVQVETAAEIARDISGSLDLDELLHKAVSLIRERFSFYHASVFLLDQPGEFAIIREATGEAGAQMKRQGHKIGVGSKSIVGFVSSKGETLIVSDTTRDLTYYPNPLLPDTRAEAAIPLRVGDRILGVLDVQSDQPYAFHEDNLRSLQILADQLAVAVSNTELFAETQEHLSQHRLLHHITSSAASGTTLEEALESAVSGLQVTLGGDRVMILLADREKRTLEVKASVGYAEDISKLNIEIGKGVVGWVAAHRRPLRIRDVNEDPRYIETSANTRSELAVPLIYRNEILGVVNVESEQIDAYSENDEEMLGTLGGSLAAVIANAKLVEQIRAQSERERLINDITSRIRRSTDIQSILQTTASEIARVTGARYTRIHIDPASEAKDGGES